VAPLLIADVPWLLYRAYFSLPKSITDARGHPANALLGTVNALLAAVEASSPRAVAACLGAENAAYRVRLYPAYHAHRPPMPAELARQWRQTPALLASFGWTVSESGELEADDVMFSLAQSEGRKGGLALLLTADRDLYAAVDERVAILELPKRGGRAGHIGPEQVRERYGVEPRLVSDFIALRGDPSDGIPGAPGVGAKTAAELLQAFGTLEEVLVAAGQPGTVIAGQMRPRLAAVLREHADELRMFKHLATLQRVPVRRPRDAPTDYAAGGRAARKLGMERLAQRLDALAA
jgi:DNA polymerase-1